MTELNLAVADHVATITIDRPQKLNAMTPAMIATVQGHAKAVPALPRPRSSSAGSAAAA